MHPVSTYLRTQLSKYILISYKRTLSAGRTMRVAVFKCFPFRGSCSTTHIVLTPKCIPLRTCFRKTESLLRKGVVSVIVMFTPLPIFTWTAIGEAQGSIFRETVIVWIKTSKLQVIWVQEAFLEQDMPGRPAIKVSKALHVSADC